MGNKILLKTNSIKYTSQSGTLVVWDFQMYQIKMGKQDFPHVRWRTFFMKIVR